MTKRLLALLLLLAAPAFAQTPNLSLSQPSAGAANWGTGASGLNCNFRKLDFDDQSPITITPGTCSTSPLIGLGTVTETKGGTGETTFTLGDILYSDATNSLGKLAGNTSTTAKFLCQTGTGSVSAAPSWCTPSASTLPSPLITATSQISSALCTSGKILQQTGSSWGCVSYAVGDEIKVGSTNVTSPVIFDEGPGTGGTTMGVGLSGSTITIYCPDAGAGGFEGCVNNTTQTFSGEKTFPNEVTIDQVGGLDFGDAGIDATPPDCTTSGQYSIWVDKDNFKFKKCVNGTASDLLPNTLSPITASASLTPGTITASQCADSAMTVTGATTGKPCTVGTPTSGPGTHISATCFVDATNSAKVRFCNSNTSSQTGTSGTYTVTVLQ